MSDDTRPHFKIKVEGVADELVFEMDVRRAGASRSATAARARSCVVTRPIAPRSIKPRMTASAPTVRSCEFVPWNIRRAGTRAAGARGDLNELSERG